MATNLTIRVNNGSPDIAYGASGASYLDLDLNNDYLIWTSGSSVVADGQDEPTAEELNEASTLIDSSLDVTVPYCLAFDYSANLLDKVEGMGENKRYVFAFSFDGDTASEPQLEAWDDSNHNSYDKHVLGAGSGGTSMVKAVCTTDLLPGASWVGTAIRGDDSADVVKLNHGNGAISLASGDSSKELYANIKIVIPAGYATPAVELFTLTVRYTWN